jgi:hypothetical protein
MLRVVLNPQKRGRERLDDRSSMSYYLGMLHHHPCIPALSLQSRALVEYPAGSQN